MDVLKDLNSLEEIKEQLDIFIENNPPSDVNVDRVSINTCDGQNGKFAYNYIKNKVPEKETFYNQFGSTGNGMSCFYLYKNKKDQIYLFVIHKFDSIDSYYVIEDESWFDKYI
jgi:hypothetical protein